MAEEGMGEHKTASHNFCCGYTDARFDIETGLLPDGIPGLNRRRYNAFSALKTGRNQP
jgi:hypothetical protein